MVIKYNDQLVFVVPLCILPLILKTFFDARLGLFVHVLTILILGFVVPNSFEFWEGNQNRLNKRTKYYLEKDNWIVKTLSP